MIFSFKNKKTMKKTYIIPTIEAIEVLTLQMLAASGVTGKGAGYGGVDDGTHEPAAPRYKGFDNDEEDEDEDW